jgi:HSP20 family molecular chaperone IbpA
MADTNIAKQQNAEVERTNAGRELPRYRPATDIIEREDGFHILMDLPGVKREDLVIDLNDKEVVITAPTDYPADPGADGGERYAHVEFGGGEYRRAFTLSDNVDREKIEAKLVNGVLNLHLPKSERALPKRIEINAG